ncbi:putative GTPase-activating protein [Glarea lozoyensis 74030]|uniref:Putative GTPase-activating protein n=1 Tax=Glarea lozoyensis (strain ATCC 74030 / MF5533) TaxID=1104152 RepID=H0EMV6_GLAL7|nr:putative GTPase-activating protein [Glarea lozoyensis 74030]
MDEDERRAKASRSKAAEVVSGLPENQIIEKGRVGLGPSPTQMDYDGFREFLASMAKWAVTDSPTPSEKDSPVTPKHSYFGNSVRSRQALISPWGQGPEPAEHEFMQRLFRRWDVDCNSTLTLQNVVTGLAHIKGKGDIMGTITYFFELYDDDGDGKVDREGILRISEALLFLSRRGLEGSLTPSSSSVGLSSTNERFLSSVSAFIRRCFEYADPDRPENQEEDNVPDENPEANNDAFGIGEDSDEEEEEDLLDLGPDSSPKPSFRISDKIPTPGAGSSGASLTTFSNLSFGRGSNAPQNGVGVGGSTAGVVPPGKGIRGVLDNIVSDGMRVAAEVRRRVDEAQKEMEKNAVPRPDEEDEEEEIVIGPRNPGDSERRSVRSEDRDLLEGVDAEAISIRGSEGVPNKWTGRRSFEKRKRGLLKSPRV